MIKAVIIDDEQDARYLLRKILVKHFDQEIEIIAEADSCRSAREILNNCHPDLVFLDIQLGDGTGFDLLTQMSEPGFQVVFITAYDRFAIKAIEFSALGYLVKPLNLEELKATMTRLTSQKEKQKRQQSGIKVLVENYQAGQIRKIVVPHADGFTIVQLDEIVYIKSIRNYSEFNLEGKIKILTSKTLILYEKLLAEHGFFRIHQTYLVNLSHVRSYVRSEGGALRMSNGDLLPVARQKKAELMDKFL